MTLESAYLEWNRPTMDGGSEILGYYVEYKDRNSLNWRAANRGVSRERKMKVSGLQAGLVYLFRVCTENIVGKSKWSKETDGDVARDQCSPPLNVKPVAADRTSATIEWELPEYDGGSHISGYMVERRELPGGRWLKCNYCNITDRTYQITSLTEEMNYEFRVYAHNAAGSYSEPSEPTCAVCCVDCYIAPKLDLDRHIKDTVIARAGEKIVLGADIVGRPVPTVDWKFNKRCIESDKHYTIETNSERTQIEIKDLTRDDTGPYELELTNCAGTKSITINLKVHDTPAPPIGPVEVTSVYADRVTLVWKQPGNDGCSMITNYIVERREKSRLAWTVVAPCVESLNHRITGLLEGHEYLFRVRAENKYGQGRALESIAVTTKNPFVEPGQPGRPTVTNVTKSGAMIA